MTYDETVEYLYSLLPVWHRTGKAAYKGNLDNAIALDDYFGHPHRAFKTIHVAGTNGKGSVSHMLASVLQEAGYKTGLYTSPHLRDFRERIRVNGIMIEENEVVTFIEKHKGIIESAVPSFFELTVAMAFDYFARAEVEVAVIEVGMGGRLDSTNIIMPVLSVITNIGHDHMEFLGDTLAAVAGEKAGIIKDGVPVVVGETHPETSGVFTAAAKARNTEVTFADKVFRCNLGDPEKTTAVRPYMLYDLQKRTRNGGTTPLGGLAQKKNIQTVAAAFGIIAGMFGLTGDHFVRGVANVVLNTGLMGRWQVLAQSPLTVCDTGHNREGLEYVVRQLKATPGKVLHMVIGFVNDKDLSQVLPLFPSDAVYYFTRAGIPRALDENVLKAEALKYGLAGSAYASVALALEAARAAATEDDMIFIGGSTYVVAEVVR